MDSKAMAIAVVAVVVIVAAAAAVFMTGDENDDFVGVVYDGNGGTYDGSGTYRLTSTTVQGNLFSKADHQFLNWNTRADGTGTSYKPGDTISYPEHGHVTLYAQWSTEKAYSITGYSVSSGTIGTPVTQYIQLVLDGTVLSVGTIGEVKVSGTEVIEIRYSDKCTGWTWDENTSVFKFNADGKSYTLRINVTGASYQSGLMTMDMPFYGFTPAGDVSISVSINQVM